MILNKELDSPKFYDQFLLLQKCFKRDGVSLTLTYNELLNSTDSSPYADYDFALYYDKDLLLARALENNNVIVFNNETALSVCDDKALTYLSLHDLKNVKLIPSAFSPLRFSGSFRLNSKFIQRILSLYQYPFIVKEVRGSYGNEVHLIDNDTEFLQVLQKIQNRQFIVQKYIESSKGRDIRVWVVGNKVILAVNRKSDDDNEFRSSISQGGKYEMILDLPIELKNLASRISKKLRMDFGTIDFLYGPMSGEYYFCEANTNAVFSNLDLRIGETIVDYVMRSVYDKVE